ncbi:MAG: glycosyltransferase, partial [Bryobacteraceae bacterium]
GPRGGPARARNLGVAVARGDVILFLDSDVCVAPDTISRVRAAFDEDPALDALIGSYDDAPGSKDFLSQYKNLMHCFVHQTGRRVACTFWSGCGAIRRGVFLEYSGFDEAYRRPAIEDIELGYRLMMGHRKVILDSDLVVKHLKRWTFWGLLRTDILDRGVPWTELILRDRSMPNDLNIQLSQRVSVALVFLLLGVASVTAFSLGGAFLTPLFALLFLLLARYWLEAAEPKSPLAVVGISAVVAALLALAWTHRMYTLIPMLGLTYGLLFLPHRYSYRKGRARTIARTAFGCFLAISVLFILAYLPGHPLVYCFFLLLAAVIALNNQFYLFLAARRGKLFTLAAIPFHLLYHLYNGFSFAIGVARYSWRALLARAAKRGPVVP